MSSFGQNIKISLFGESHGEAIGIVIDGLCGGIKLDLDFIQSELDKRRPKSKLSTPRREPDKFEIVSGFFEGYTTGTPLTIIIRNTNTNSSVYKKDHNLLRPGHADYTANIRYNEHQDYRGGGHFSGRLTAPLVALGAICKTILKEKNIHIASHIASIKDVEDDLLPDIINMELMNHLNSTDFPLINSKKEDEMSKVIVDATKQFDSVGGIVESIILGIPPGFGSPVFESVESVLSHLLFSIPAVKGVEFGKGFNITKLFGSEANDPFIYTNKIETTSNNNGGINGGITNGMPITLKTAIKPTPSIHTKQQTVHYKKKENTTLEVVGRHDPCITHRAIHVVNAMLAYGILEIMVRQNGDKWMLNE